MSQNMSPTEQRDAQLTTALMYALHNGDVEIIALLLSDGTNIAEKIDTSELNRSKHQQMTLTGLSLARVKNAPENALSFMGSFWNSTSNTLPAKKDQAIVLPEELHVQVKPT